MGDGPCEKKIFAVYPMFFKIYLFQLVYIGFMLRCLKNLFRICYMCYHNTYKQIQIKCKKLVFT